MSIKEKEGDVDLCCTSSNVEEAKLVKMDDFVNCRQPFFLGVQIDELIESASANENERCGDQKL